MNFAFVQVGWPLLIWPGITALRLRSYDGNAALFFEPMTAPSCASRLRINFTSQGSSSLAVEVGAMQLAWASLSFAVSSTVRLLCG